MYDNIEDVIRYAVRSAQVTHNHIDGVKGAVVTAVCIYMAKNGYTKEEIKGYLDKHYKYNKEQLNELSEGKLFYLIDSQNNFKTDHSLYCNFAVPYAIDMFLKTDNFEECMAAIVENFGDTDTVCAIVGSICFAYYKLDYKTYAEVFETYLPEEFLNEIK